MSQVNSMSNDELILNFGKYIGIKNLKLGFQRSCQLIFPEGKNILINEVNSENILLHSIVGKIPGNITIENSLYILSLNMLFKYTNQPYLNWDPDKKILLLTLPIYTQDIDIYLLDNQIKSLITDMQMIFENLQEKGIYIIEVEY